MDPGMRRVRYGKQRMMAREATPTAMVSGRGGGDVVGEEFDAGEEVAGDGGGCKSKEIFDLGGGDEEGDAVGEADGDGAGDVL